MPTLRDYQQKMVDDIRQSFLVGNKRVLLCASVGAGKMAVLTYIANKSALAGHRVYLIFHTQQLVKQACEWLQAWGARYGIEAASFGKNLDPEALIQVCMVQTVRSRLKYLPEPRLIIEDESHHSSASTYKTIRSAYKDALVIGFTATPVRLGGELLFGNDGFQDLIMGPQPKWLTDHEHLTPVRLFSQPSVADLSGVRNMGGDFNEGDLDEAMTDEVIGLMVGDCIAEYRKHCENKPALAACVSVRHAERVAAKFRAAGYSAECIHGGMDKEQRDDLMRRFESGEIKILSYCQLLGEGVDVPAVTALFFMRPTRSIVIWLQACGRVMRRSSGKEEAFVFDHVGNTKQKFWDVEMGHPSEDFPWYDVLEKMALKKKKAKEGSQALPFKRCPSCLEINMRSSAVCPYCGFDYLEAARKQQEEEAIQAELIEIEHTRKKDAKKQINSLQDAIEYAKQNNYAMGWAYKYWKNSWKNKAAMQGTKNSKMP